MEFPIQSKVFPQTQMPCQDAQSSRRHENCGAALQIQRDRATRIGPWRPTFSMSEVIEKGNVVKKSPSSGDSPFFPSLVERGATGTKGLPLECRPIAIPRPQRRRAVEGDEYEVEKPADAKPPRSFLEPFRSQPLKAAIDAPNDQEQIAKVKPLAERKAQHFLGLPGRIGDRRLMAPMMVEVEGANHVPDEKKESHPPYHSNPLASLLQAIAPHPSQEGDEKAK